MPGCFLRFYKCAWPYMLFVFSLLCLVLLFPFLRVLNMSESPYIKYHLSKPKKCLCYYKHQFFFCGFFDGLIITPNFLACMYEYFFIRYIYLLCFNLLFIKSHFTYYLMLLKNYLNFQSLSYLVPSY